MSQNDIQNESNSDRINRRTALKATGAAVTLASVPATARQNRDTGEDERVQSSLRKFDDPVDQAEIQENRNAAYQRYLQSGGEEKDVFGESKHTSIEEKSIVSHIVGFDAQRGLREYIGVAENPEDVQPIHQDAARFQQSLKSELQQAPLTTSSTDDFSTTSTAYWDTLDDSTVTYNDCSVGIVRVDYVEKYLQSDGDSLYDYVAIRQNVQIMPGTLSTNCGGDTGWVTCSATMEHDWSAYNAFRELEKDGPESDSGVNTYSVDLSLQDAGFSWSHSEPAEEIENLSNTSSGYMKWGLSIGKGAEGTKLEHQPGSTAKYYPDDQDSVDLFDMMQEADFRLYYDDECAQTVGGDFVMGVNYGGGTSPYQ